MISTALQWTCKFCGSFQVGSIQNSHASFTSFPIGKSKHGLVGYTIAAQRCLNSDCNDVSLYLQYVTVTKSATGENRIGDVLDFWRLKPDDDSKVIPEYIPDPVREDYYEACKIRDRSPKASATLARRCLQGMIRDFCGISRKRLIDEINDLRKAVENGTSPKGVEPETIDAIDAIRSIGNIGAHMEQDISVIVDVDVNEARALLELIEMLFEEWYVARHKRDERLKRVQAIAAEKHSLKQGKIEQS